MIARRGALELGAWLGVVLGAALAGACFAAPKPAVQFSCEPARAPQCPPGYTCEADGCCHLDGSNYEEHEGECQLGGIAPTGTGPGETTETTASTSSSTSTGEASSSGTDGPTTGDSTSGSSDGGTTGESESESGSSSGS